MCSQTNSRHKTNTHSLWLCACLFSPLTCSWERQALAMNRWTEQTAMLSSLISEKTVKKGAPFSHTLSLFHSFVHLSVSVHRSAGRTGQSRSWHSPSRSAPLLLASYLLSPVFISYFPCLPFTPGNYADMHLSSSTSTSPFFLFQHQHSLTSPSSLLSCHFMFDKKPFSNIIRLSLSSVLFSTVLTPFVSF